jgi:hypothetical protein
MSRVLIRTYGEPKTNAVMVERKPNALTPALRGNRHELPTWRSRD